MPEGSQSALHQGPMGEESLQSSMPLCNSEHDQTNTDMGPDCYSRLCEEPSDAETERPVSLVSTLSSDSSRDSRSLFGSTITLPVSTTPPLPCGEDIDLELSPAECGGGQAGDHSNYTASTSNNWLERLESKGISNLWNRNNGGSNRKSSPELPHIHASPIVTSAMAPNPNLTYADRVVMELIETERMYVKDLSSIVEDYLAHIIDINNLPIQPEQVCALFGNIEDIYEFNSELLQSLDMCENDPVAIAKCFVDKSEYFEIYTQYCTNYPNSVAALTECMRNKTLAKFFRDRQAALKRSLPLGSFLLKPVQRILKYHLLLQEIAKHFDPDEEGHEVVQEAIDTMTSVAWYINDMKRKHEHAVRVQEIQSLLINWKGLDLTTYGELVLEGTFHVLRAKNTRTLFLFERMLLITKKRGEHYVYKIHISCSTLMLLDSAKDPLLFSVIHFKRPKQPHTVQAKSVEEKRLWAHHIKRLILENHSAIVPQKAKDAILDNSNYLGKHQYSPERLIKADSCQTEDFNLGGRKGRRRSEPAKQIMGNTKAALKHADSEGALMGNRHSLRPATSVSTLTSSLSQPQARMSYDDSQTPREDSLEQLCSTNSGSSPGEGGRELEQTEKARRDEEEEEDEEEEGDSYKEDVLMGDDQDNHNTDMTEEEAVLKDKSETHVEEDRPVDVTETLTSQVNMEELCPSVAISQEDKSDQQESSLCPASPVASPQLETETSESQEISRETVEEEEEVESDSSHLPLEETSVTTNGELSEEEEGLDCGPILSSPMLDQASMRAERFVISSSRRSSLVSEDLGSLACPSPTAECEVFKSPSACMDFEKQAQIIDSSTPEPADALTEGERRSTLSKKDQLLIHKIRRYYEHAEHQDAAFSIKRRESLSYIPAGLVRHLSQQLNSVPQEQAVPVHRKSPYRNRPTSWSIFDLPGLEKCRNTASRRSGETQRSVDVRTRSQSVTDITPTEEEFRPPVEILKVLQDMEIEEEDQEGLQDEEKIDESSMEETEDMSSDTFDNHSADQSVQILKQSEVCSTSDSSSVSSHSSASPRAVVRSALETEPSKIPVSPEKSHFSHSKLPNIISFRTSMEEDQILQDMGKMKNKVFQLARQYSQRIKNNRPMVWQRNRDAANQQGCKSTPAGHEEKMHPRKKGKLNLRLPLMACDEMVIHEVQSPSPVQSPSSVSNCQLSVPCPQNPQSEAFHWPDVQELCSKYTSPFSKGSHSCATLSGCCRNRCNTCLQRCSSSLELHRPLTRTDANNHALEDWPQRRRTPLQPLLCRWNSLDHMLGSVPFHEGQNLHPPLKNCCTGSKLQNWDRPFSVDDTDCAAMSGVLTLGKMSDSNLVKSLREKFQSLGTNS